MNEAHQIDDSQAYCIRAGAIYDGVGCAFSPGVVVVEAGKILWSGHAQDVPAMYADIPLALDLPQSVLLPGLVNAHTHLELTALGQFPYPGDFVAWIKQLRESLQHRHASSGQAMAQWLAASAKAGAKQAMEAGTMAVGDIVSDPLCMKYVAEVGLAGVSYLELFGLGEPFDQPALERIAMFSAREADSIHTLGLQPHAPYSAGPALYERAIEANVPVSTHLAETLMEDVFIRNATGPMRDYLEQIGRWSPAFASAQRRAASPVQYMSTWLKQADWLLAHCNYVSDDDIDLLAATGSSVAYCPIAAEYFGHKVHRYREMLEAGVRVCLGTDALVCQPNVHQPMSMLWPMRRLYQRDRTSPKTLLAMATTHGAAALRLPAKTATLQPGALAFLCVVDFDPLQKVDPLVQVLLSDHPIRTVGVK